MSAIVDPFHRIWYFLAVLIRRIAELLFPLLVLIGAGPPPAFAADFLPADPSQALNFVRIALQNTDAFWADFPNRGVDRISCEPVIAPPGTGGSPDDFRSTGEKQDIVIAVSQARCIRAECAALPVQVTDRSRQLLNDPQTLARLLFQEGKTEDQIRSILEHPPQTLPPVTCENAVQIAVEAYDLCVALPYQCAEISQ